MYPVCMIACAATHIACVVVLFVLTVLAAIQRSVPARKKKQAKDELAPLVSALDLGISFTRGVAGVGAAVSGASREIASAAPVPYTQRQLKADSGSQTLFCAGAEGVPDAVRAGLANFTSIVRATARVTNMFVDDMCSSGEIQVAVAAIKKSLSGASCRGAIEAMKQSASSSASDPAHEAIVALVETIADATCSATNTIDGAKLGVILDGVGAALCSPSELPDCAGIGVKTSPTEDVYVAHLVRALARAVRVSAVHGARARCNLMITSVRGMDKEFAAIAAVLRAKEITLGCTMIKTMLESRAEMGDASPLVSVVRSSLVSVLCAHSDALATLSPADLKELVISTIRAMCSA
jgi:hypothetical protein